MTPITYKDINVIYEDNHIIVVVKPFNIPSQADNTGDKDMLSLVKEHIVHTKKKKGDAFVGLVQRLDRPTGGVMVFAKTSKSASRLCEMIRNNELEKRYFAVVCGEPVHKTGKLQHYLKKDARTNVVVIAPLSEAGAKLAELDYKMIDYVGGFSLIDINLITGRSHQARVQMASMGTPIFADMKYGADQRSKGYNLALFASEIKFSHPVTRERMVFRVFPPTEATPWKSFNIEKHLNLDIKNLSDSQ